MLTAGLAAFLVLVLQLPLAPARECQEVGVDRVPGGWVPLRVRRISSDLHQESLVLLR